jgi:hypothetical protein
MSIPDKWFEKTAVENITTIYLTNRNITTIYLKHHKITSLLFLSLSNNQIKSISFLNSFPAIWYIDLKNNPIEDFDVLNKKNSLGYLGVTLNKFSEQNFFQLKKLNLGILNIDGEIDDISKYNNFIYNSSNNFLKVNNKVILFSDKFKILSLSSNEILSMFTQHRTRGLQQKSSTMTMFRRTSNKIIRLDTVQNDLSDFEDIKAFFTLFKNSMVKIIEGIVSQTKLKAKDIFDFPEYINLEKTKLRTLFKVYQDILILNKHDSRIVVSHKNEKIKYIDFSVLKINEESVQCIILCVILLYIVSILSVDIAERLLNILLKKYKDDAVLSINLAAVLRVEKSILLCCYYELLEYYRDDENFITENNLYKLTSNSNIKKNYYLSKLDIDNLVSNVNILQNRESEILHIFDKNSSFSYRKNIISLVLINFLEKELNILDNVLSLTQQIFDYIILNNLESDICKELSNDYKVFLEIRNSLLDKYEKNNIRNEYNPYCDRLYNDYKWKQLGRDFNITLNNIRKPKVVNQTNTKSLKQIVTAYSVSSIKIKLTSIKPLISSYRSHIVLPKPFQKGKEILTDSSNSEPYHPNSRNKIFSTRVTMLNNTNSFFLNTETSEENRRRNTYRSIEKSEFAKSSIRVNTEENIESLSRLNSVSSNVDCKSLDQKEESNKKIIPINYTRLLKKLKVN